MAHDSNITAPQSGMTFNVTPKESRMPLVSVELEKRVIGELMNSNKENFFKIKEFLTEDCFYMSMNRTIYKAIKAVCENGDNPDMPIVCTEIVRQNPNLTLPQVMPEVASIVAYSVFTGQLARNAIILQDFARRRLLKMTFDTFSAKVNQLDTSVEEIVENLHDKLKTIMQDSGVNAKTLTNALEELYERVKTNLSTGGQHGSYTGFEFIDDRGGFQPSDLIVLGGRTSQGKTSFLLSIISHLIREGEKTALFSLEMTNEQLAARLVSGETFDMKAHPTAAELTEQPIILTSNTLLNVKLTDAQYKVFDRAIGNIMVFGDCLYFDDRSRLSIEVIISSIRTLHSKYGIKGAAIDYLQSLSSAADTRGTTLELLYGDWCRQLKNLAKELNIWIIIVSQLRRDNDPEPTKEQLRGSGQIEENADQIYLIYRPEFYGKEYTMEGFEDISTKGTALVKLDKGRNISTGAFICGWDAATTKYYNIPYDRLPHKTDIVKTNQTTVQTAHSEEGHKDYPF